jgi:hypothetical protein
MSSSSRHSTSFTLSTAVALAIGIAGPAAAQTTIGAGGGGLIQSWGKDNTQTYGQTITTPSDNILNSFSFWLGRTSTNFPDPSNPSLSFMGYVYEWSEAMSHAVGPALYTSGVFTHDATPATPFTEYTFNTGGLSLTTGSTYALFLSTSGLAGSGRIQWESATGDEYAGGHFIFLNNGENTSAWTTDGWSSQPSDLHFEATFAGVSTTVPEPSTWVMLVTGLLALGVVAMRRRRNGGELEA